MTTTVRIGRRARRSVAAAAGVALIGGLGFGLAAPVASASADDKVCGPLDSGKIDTEGDPDVVEVEAPSGQLISAYCVKAGSANQGDGPVTTTLDTPVAVLEIRSATGKAVSHYSVSYVDAPQPGATETTTVSASPSPTVSGTPSGEPSESVTPGETVSASPTLTSTATVTPSEDPSEGTPTEPASASPSVSTTDPAAACPGLGDDEDYRSLFTYEYFAADPAGGWVSLGSSLNWDDAVGVQYLNGFATDPIEDMMVRAVVTLREDVDITAGGCEYEFSLASYEAQGPTFGTSGQQVFIDHDTDTITEDITSITLEVEPAVCFGQSDLYKGSDVYDGDRTPRGPGYAPITMDDNMIANWAGGYGCDDEPTGTPTPGTTAPTDTPSDTPSENPSGTPSETVSVTPSDSPSPGVTVTSSDSPSATVTPTESLSPGATTGTTTSTTSTTSTSTTSVAAGTTGSTTTPAVRGAVTQRPSSALARTGTEAWTVALVAGVLLVAGGAMTALAQGSSRGRRH